ncbi:hypothetical protein MSG28_010376 [Choristoneura fumiferana]|uniref:Uncharacterized protein n=1 Tax=Choristoneura fumiferana TaxID=7141 RepID=A0ACC0KK85_CHOFU|nr:hypothetical protein MSG28_010376 [Choristoneura fumiferana]
MLIIIQAMLNTRAIAERALQNFGGDSNLIPAGLNLGGHCMLRMPQSVLFFHRMKLRNNTHFRINFLQNDLSNMLVTLRFSLNDLHLMGDYERAITYSSPSTLYYTPTYGELEFLLKDVEYNVEGRYRLIDDRLYVEHVISELMPRRILMRYMKENNTASMTTVKLDIPNIYPYLLRMQNDLDHWLKDYFNDFLIYFDLPGTGVNSQNQAYENAKTMIRNRFADSVIKGVRKRLRQVNSSSIMIPDFKIYSVNEMEITLYDGIIRGLDTIFRRSVTTGKLDRANVRHLDTIVGFSTLKVEYKYNMFLRTGLPPLFGMLVLDVDELTARLALKTVRDSPTLDMHYVLMAPFDKARSLVVEGPANRYIAKYKHILENQISSIMSSTLMHYMQQLDSLARCHTHLIGKDDPKYKTIDDSESVESKNENGPADDGGDVTNSEPEQVTDATDNDDKQAADYTAAQNIPEDYVVDKKESIELEFPAKDEDKKSEKMKLEINQKFSLTRLNKGERRTG